MEGVNWEGNTGVTKEGYIWKMSIEGNTGVTKVVINGKSQ